MLKKWWLTACVVLPGVAAISAFAAPALAPGYSIDTLGTQSGLPQHVVTSILQTRDGYLWVGTLQGLARFDGLRFKTFDESTTPGLNTSRILRLFEDSQGMLWIGTEGGGLVTAKDGQVTTIDLGESGRNSSLVSICEDNAGGIWMRLENGQLFRYHNGKSSLLASGCNALAAENSGVVWVGTPTGGLMAFGPMPTNVDNAFPMAYDSSGAVPVGRLDFLQTSSRGGCWRFANGRIEKWSGNQRQRELGEYPWSYGVLVTCACEDLQGNLIVGTYGEGVYSFDAAGKPTQLQGLPHSSILSVFVDREGDLWVGSNGGGLNRVRRQVLAVLGPTRGLTVQSVAQDAQGVLWIGYNGENRLDRWGPDGLQTERVGTNFPNLPIRALLTDPSNRLWVGTYGGGLFQRRGERFETFPLPAGLSSYILALHEDGGGKLWVGAQNGLASWDGKVWQLFTVRSGLSAGTVRAVAVDGKGGIWAGTEGGGLDYLQAGQVTHFTRTNGLPSNNVQSLYLDREGILWVGTSGGLVRHDERTWTSYTRDQGLPSNSVGYIIEDSEGFLWLASTAGLLRVEKKALNDFAAGKSKRVLFREFGEAEGLPSSECTFGSQPASCRTREGSLWFPTIRGLATVAPSTLQRDKNAPPVLLEAIRVDGQPLVQERLRGTPLRSVTLRPGNESIEIDYASLNLASPRQGRFRYRLQGFDSEWIERPGDVRTVRYSRLPPRQYRFELTACNADGTWNTIGTSLAITVQPPFWRTPWFITLVTLFLVGVIVASVHYASTQRLQRQLGFLRQQEALEKERARIARDLHDQLGANLTQVALLGEMAEADKNLPEEVESHARQISHTAHETTRALDEIVWTVNPSNDTLDGLINYICKYAQEYLALAGLRYRLEVPADLPNAPITPELRHNLFLVAKEAVNNIVKHSQATAAWLRLRLAPDSFVLEIEDNGKGIAPGAEDKGRSGLKNMRKRMQDIGGEFQMNAGSEGGTKLRFTAPLKRG